MYLEVNNRGNNIGNNGHKIKEIPNSIYIRINVLSSSKNIFDNHRGFYNEALHNISYKNELMYL